MVTRCATAKAAALQVHNPMLMHSAKASSAGCPASCVSSLTFLRLRERSLTDQLRRVRLQHLPYHAEVGRRGIAIRLV